MSGMLFNLRKDLQQLANLAKARILAGFFKTGPGEYGEGDVFLGVTVPQVRGIARKYSEIGLPEAEKLLKSPVHEERLASLLILVHKFKLADSEGKKAVFSFYLKNAKLVNNWDLVDLTAPNILGAYLLAKDKSVLYRLARSQNLWERRMAVVATYEFIRHGHFKGTFEIAEVLLKDSHDLIHKAVGWMLREVGKRDQAAEEKFLMQHYKTMPRTMLRYAIERFEKEKRRQFMMR